MATKKSGRRASTKRALCVGINNYPGTGSDLSGCVNDALDWKAALTARGYEVATLLDSQATYAAMARALRTLIDGARTGESLVFTYSGHGSWLPDEDGDERDGRDEMLCPYDLDRGGYLMDDEIAEIFGRKPAGVRLYFISDSCHSGTVSRFAPSPFPAAAMLQPRPRFLPPSSFVKNRRVLAMCERVAEVAVSSRTVYPALLAAGCRDTEYSYDASFGGRPNGAFTYFALKALAKKPKTPRLWMDAIRLSLPSAVHPQSPRLYGSSAQKSGLMF